MLYELFYVGLGGSLGAMSRYAIGQHHLWESVLAELPLATFCVNTIGCFLIGVAAELCNHPICPAFFKLMIIPGFLGGFTTYSSFAYESFNLFEQKLPLLGISYIAATLLACMIAVWFGAYLIRVVAV